MHLCRQWNCWSLRCSWSIACRRCPNYIFILDLTQGFIGFGKGNCKMRRETFQFWDLVQLILEILQYFSFRSVPVGCFINMAIRHGIDHIGIFSFSCLHAIKEITYVLASAAEPMRWLPPCLPLARTFRKWTCCWISMTWNCYWGNMDRWVCPNDRQLALRAK